MCPARRILFTDKELTSNVLPKQLRIGDRKVLDAAYNGKINVRPQNSTAGKKLKSQDLIDRRYIDGRRKMVV